MAAPAAEDRLPRLAFVFHPVSFSALAIADAARDVCEVLWLIDSGDPRLGNMPRLMARLGTVRDIGGMTGTEAADALRGEGIDGVLALAEECFEWTAALAAALGLPYLGREAALALTDKFVQREAFRAAGLPTPGSWVLRGRPSAEEIRRLTAGAEFPAVLKPRQGSGSRDTMAVGSVEEAASVLGLDDGEAGVDAHEWVLEEYIADIDAEVCGARFANYVSVESAVVDGRVSSLAITGRTPPAPPFRETGFFIPAAIDAEQAAAVVSAAERAALALGITIGCLHTEVKLTPTGPVVIEVNGRIGGGISELLSLTTELDFLALALEIALGRRPRLPGLLQTRGVAYLFYVQAPDDVHTITAITGLEELRADEGVKEITLNRSVGDPVDWHDGNHGYVFSVLGIAENHDGVRDALDRVAETVRIDGS